MASDLQGAAAAEELVTSWARPVLRQEWESKSLGLITSTSGKQGRVIKVESCSPQDLFYFSLFYGKDNTVGSGHYASLIAAQMAASPKGPKGEQAALKRVASASCIWNIMYWAVLWAGQPGNCCTFKYAVFLGHAQNSAVRKSLPLSRLSFHATVLLSHFSEVKMHLRALQTLLSGTIFAGCFGGFASPCSFQVEPVGCTGWSEMLKCGSLKAAGQTQEYYHAHPSLFWQDQ